MEIRLEDYQYYIRPGYTDMRKGASSLAYIVQDEMNLEPFEKSVFVFCGRSKRTVKAIVWDRNGWIEITKRVECGFTFFWPKTETEAMKVTVAQIVGMLNGYDMWRPFPNFKPEMVC